MRLLSVEQCQGEKFYAMMSFWYLLVELLYCTSTYESFLRNAMTSKAGLSR